MLKILLESLRQRSSRRRAAERAEVRKQTRRRSSTSLHGDRNEASMATPRSSPFKGGDVIGSLRCARQKAEYATERIVHGTKEIKTQKASLRELLSKKLATATELFGMWDTDNSGTISRSEFQEAVAALGYGFPPDMVDEVFDEFDSDGSGEMDYSEYVRFALRDGLKRSSGRVMEFFRKMDKNGDGQLDKREFRQGLSALGWEVHDPYLLDEVFDMMDKDRNGALSFAELHRHLRQGFGMAKQIGGFLAEGAAGKIETAPINKTALRGSLEQQFLLMCNKPFPPLLGKSKEEFIAAATGDGPALSPAGNPGECSRATPSPELISSWGTLKLPGLSPRPLRAPPTPKLMHDILTERASPRPRRNDFVVEDPFHGRTHHTIQDEQTAVASSRTPQTTKFFRTRTSFQPVVTTAIWENPLPAINPDGSPVWIRAREPPALGTGRLSPGRGSPSPVMDTSRSRDSPSPTMARPHAMRPPPTTSTTRRALRLS